MQPSEATSESAEERRAKLVAEILERRLTAGLSQGALGTLMGYDRTYVNKVERGATEPTAEFARKVDETLGASGSLVRLWQTYAAAKGTQHPPQVQRPHSASDDTAADVVVERDEAWLTFEGDAYALRMRKQITNVGEAPVTRFFIRVAVDRYPNDPGSNDWHRHHPLTLDELELRAWSGDERMTFDVKQDRDATKELWLLFHNEHRLVHLQAASRRPVPARMGLPRRSGSVMATGERLRARLQDLGIRQEGDPILRAVARPFDLPGEADAAHALLAELRDRVARVAELYPFRKGMGLAAPQIGVSRAAAIVRPADGGDLIALVNPAVVERSPESDDRYEGCLSFFDVRGMKRRPLRIVVEASRPDGSRFAETFERGIARLVLHEVDHLLGRLYADELAPGSKLLPLEEYRGTRASWSY